LTKRLLWASTKLQEDDHEEQEDDCDPGDHPLARPDEPANPAAINQTANASSAGQDVPSGSPSQASLLLFQIWILVRLTCSWCRLCVLSSLRTTRPLPIHRHPPPPCSPQIARPQLYSRLFVKRLPHLPPASCLTSYIDLFCCCLFSLDVISRVWQGINSHSFMGSSPIWHLLWLSCVAACSYKFVRKPTSFRCIMIFFVHPNPSSLLFFWEGEIIRSMIPN